MTLVMALQLDLQTLATASTRQVQAGFKEGGGAMKQRTIPEIGLLD